MNINVIALSTIFFNQGAKRIVFIDFAISSSLDFFKNISHWLTSRFIGVKYYIYTFRHIVTINSHAFQISIIANKNTDLSIMGITERKVVNPSSNLDNTIFLNTTLFCIPNFQSTRIETFRIHKTLTTRFPSWNIFQSIVDGGINLVILINIFVLSIRRTKNFQIGLFTRIGYLRNTATINLIAFSLKNRQCLIKLLF